MKLSIGLIKGMIASYFNSHSGTSTMLVKTVQGGDTFPTTRPNGSALLVGDWVKPKDTATFPFTISGITFNSINDQAVWGGASWLYNANPFQKTNETPVANKTSESLAGTSDYQSQINAENKTAINDLISKVMQVSTMPTASASLVGKILQFIGTTTADYINGYFYVCEEVTPATTPATYRWAKKKVQDLLDFQINGASAVVNGVANVITESAYNSSTNKIATMNDVKVIQVSTMPSAQAGQLNKIYQYIGATDTNYTNGYFYKCVEDAELVGVYLWQRVDVQPSGGGSSVEFDEKTIIKGTDNKYKTAIGGYVRTVPEDAILLVQGNATKTGPYTFTWATPSTDIKRLYEEVAVNDIEVSLVGEIDGTTIDETVTGTASAISSNEVRWVIRDTAESFRLYVTYNHSTETASIEALTGADATNFSLDCKYVVEEEHEEVETIPGKVVPIDAEKFTVDSHGDITLCDIINIDLTATELTDDEKAFIQAHENIIVRSQIDGFDIYLNKLKVDGDEYIFVAVAENGTVLALTLNTDTKAISTDYVELSSVSVSETGSSTEQVQYITINGTEYKLAGGGGSDVAFNKSMTKDANDKWGTVLGGYDATETFSGSIIKERYATLVSDRHYQFTIEDDAKEQLSSTFKTLDKLPVHMYNKVVIAGTEIEHEQNLQMNYLTDAVWNITLKLIISGTTFNVPIELNAATGKMTVDFTAIPTAYPIESVFANVTCEVSIGGIVYVNNDFLKLDPETMEVDSSGRLKSKGGSSSVEVDNKTLHINIDGKMEAAYEGGKVVTSVREEYGISEESGTYMGVVGEYKMFTFGFFGNPQYFIKGNKVDVKVNINGTIYEDTDKFINNYSIEGNNFVGAKLDGLFEGYNTYVTIIDSEGVLLSNSPIVEETAAVICKHIKMKQNVYSYYPIKSVYVPTDERFFVKDSSTDLIKPKIEFGTWDEASQVSNYNGSPTEAWSHGYIEFNAQNSTIGSFDVTLDYAMTLTSSERIKTTAKGHFEQQGTYYITDLQLESGDVNAIQTIMFFPGSPASIRLILNTGVVTESEIASFELSMVQTVLTPTDHPLDGKYVKTDGTTIKVDATGKLYAVVSASEYSAKDNSIKIDNTTHQINVQISEVSNNAIVLKDDGLYVDTTSAGYEPDGKTIKKNASNQLESVVGGWSETTGGVTTYHKSDARFIDVDGDTMGLDENNKLKMLKSIPSKTSDLTNDSNFIDSSYHDSTKLNTSAITHETWSFVTEAGPVVTKEVVLWA